VFWIGGPFPPGRELLLRGGLLHEAVRSEPWRLVTSLFLHSGPSHVLWNGLALLVFAVPLLERLGLVRCAAIYLCSGIGGGLTAAWFADAGTLIIGSSGAVAGLFGAWVVIRLRLSRSSTLTGRERIRTLGIAMLVLPSLVQPVTSDGRSVSVSSHLGGMLTGMAIGVVLCALMRSLSPDRDGEDDDERPGTDLDPFTGSSRDRNWEVH
jgi:rhomboid protease GluP